MFRRLLPFILGSVGIMVIVFSCAKKNNPATTEEDDTRILGTVIQKSIGHTVYLTQGRAVDSCVADAADGYFEFAGVQPGNYEVKVAAAEYDTYVVEIEIQEGNAIYIGAIYLVKNDPFADEIPSVYDHYPQDRAELVFNPYTQYTGTNPQRLYISISFDRPMDRESVKNALTIDPAVSGYFVWSQNRQQYNTVPEGYTWNGAALMTMADMAYGAREYVPPATISTYSKVQSFTFYFNLSDCYTDTTYTIKLSRAALDTGGVALDDSLEFSFRTVQSAVSYDQIEMNPYDGEDFVDLFRSDGITLTFPKRMDQASTEANLTVVPGNNVVYIWKDYNKLTIYTGGILIPDTTYTVAISRNALDTDGNPLDQDYTFSFSTRGITLRKSTPVNGALMVSPWDNIVLEFNTYMDKNNFAGRLFLVSDDGDTVSGALEYYNYTSGGRTYWVKEKLMYDPVIDLQYNKKYTLSILPGITDIWGFPMRYDYRIVFITMP